MNTHQEMLDAILDREKRWSKGPISIEMNGLRRYGRKLIWYNRDTKIIHVRWSKRSAIELSLMNCVIARTCPGYCEDLIRLVLIDGQVFAVNAMSKRKIPLTFYVWYALPVIVSATRELQISKKPLFNQVLPLP